MLKYQTLLNVKELRLNGVFMLKKFGFVPLLVPEVYINMSILRNQLYCEIDWVRQNAKSLKKDSSKESLPFHFNE